MTFLLTGKAGDVNFKCDPKGSAFDQYRLKFDAKSTSPITHFKILYKAQNDLQWITKELPGVNIGRELYSGSFTIGGLKPATRYWARVASKNAVGYTSFGEIFKFTTKADVHSKTFPENAAGHPPGIRTSTFKSSAPFSTGKIFIA